MFLLYDLIFLIIAIIYTPVYLFRRKFHQGFLRRLGVLPRDLELNNPIWIHAVSVGEAIAVKPLAEELRRLYPAKKFVISTVTPTGNKIAQGLIKEGDFLTYLPLDFSLIVASVINRIKPCLFIIAETEIWPNLISCLYKKHIPTTIVNGRISDKSFVGYLCLKFLLKPLLDKIDNFCVQTNTDAKRLSRLGVAQDKIHICGNMKFDIQGYIGPKKDYADERRKLGFDEQDKFLVCGSTHSGEEEVVLKVYKELSNRFPNLRLLIAPRHPQRAKEVGRLIEESGFQPLFISNLNPQSTIHNLQPVFILDTIGQLINYYAIADVVFVGGSLIRKGGHNILEPAAQGRPIIFGPYMFNFREIAELFIQQEAAISVRSQQELQEKIAYLLSHPDEANRLGQRARDLLLQNQGATHKLLQYIKI